MMYFNFNSSPLASRSNSPLTMTSPTPVGLSLSNSPPHLWATSDDSLEATNLRRNSREQSGGHHLSFALLPFMHNLHHHHARVYAVDEDQQPQVGAKYVSLN
jgi:hypothetical protein